MRARGVMIAIAALTAAITAGFGTASAEPSANEKAYTLTLMCSVVAAHFGGDADILRTADASRKMAKAYGADDHRVAADMITMANVLGDEMRRDASSIDRHREVCRKLGLVS